MGSTIQKYPEIKLLHTRFHQITCCELLDYITDVAKQRKKTVVGNVNIRAMNFAYTQPWFQDFINTSDLVFCDGFGVLLASRLSGYKLESKHRTTCADYLDKLAKACEKESLSLYLLAGKPGVVDRAIAKLSIVAPNLKIGGHHGYFEKEGHENEAIVAEINQFKPDILYVGFGMPIQERWILDNMHKIDTRVFLPLGACLDFYTGTLPRAPKWITDSGLEWLARLLTEPRRLWVRYVIGNPLFFYRIFKDILSERLRALMQRPVSL
ncbi:WecB/TagA/CpsF family glycosyltransferase [Thermocoleostomius sinensis]|jgi:N-acetylglucosaminyldiphosphoundecaprenol N-acetyl-beta-D-mannosaminyltransferase|uniref:WecB/TagA/CpsF family glycosyltransferase n=1 Tax=Thermocoleostomius sinensis A174 TaxID=2016057 RepID=A0A9E9C330_9CYAN|nr:WecB/TagA/CpsF family glycosyltransferase [Thermocoleostomius sinensis]WAL58531.1 WecB/TagA/CpsF family glycosyltransferase [Thermocoleostomius sinensis A174]